MHFRHALDLDAGMNATPWLAHTRYQYARMLMRRAGNDDISRASGLMDEALITAQELGMHGLLERIKENANAC